MQPRRRQILVKPASRLYMPASPVFNPPTRAMPLSECLYVAKKDPWACNIEVPGGSECRVSQKVKSPEEHPESQSEVQSPKVRRKGLVLNSRPAVIDKSLRLNASKSEKFCKREKRRRQLLCISVPSHPVVTSSFFAGPSALRSRRTAQQKRNPRVPHPSAPTPWCCTRYPTTKPACRPPSFHP